MGVLARFWRKHNRDRRDRSLRVWFSPEDYAVLEGIVARRESDMETLVNEAFGWQVWLDTIEREGARLLIERDDERREVFRQDSPRDRAGRCP